MRPLSLRRSHVTSLIAAIACDLSHCVDRMRPLGVRGSQSMARVWAQGRGRCFEPRALESQATSQGGAGHRQGSCGSETRRRTFNFE
eukprot:3304911-Prymnesium_polylepis.1